jgi:O-antigen ligase
VEFAHDDWLQLLAEAGVVGFCVLLIPAGVLVRRGWREGGVAGRWGLAGCGAIALFAWIDFPLNNPAVLMLGVVMLSSASELAGSGHRKRCRQEAGG